MEPGLDESDAILIATFSLRTLERDREDISNLVSIVILTNVLENEKRVVGTSNRIIEIRNISIERLLLFHANYLFYEFNSINSSLLSRVYFRFFFFFTRTRDKAVQSDNNTIFHRE